MSLRTENKPTSTVDVRGSTSHAREMNKFFFVKLVLMALVNAFGLFVLYSSWQVGHWGMLAAMVVLLLTRALSITSALSFRYVDVLRLAIFTLLTMPLRTLALVSLGILVIGISLFLGDYAFLFLASVLTCVLQRSERPVIRRLREQFTATTEE